MTLACWLAGFFSDYQTWATLISVLAGFAGIVVTLVVQRRHDIERDDANDERARRRLLVAFRTEMRGIIEHGEGATKDLTDNSDFLFPRQPPFPLFGALAGKLDVLNEEEVAKIVAVYVWLHEITQRLSLLAPGGNTPPDYLLVPRDKLGVIKSLFSQLEKLAIEAETCLSKSLGE